MKTKRINEEMAQLDRYFYSEDLDCWFNEYERGIPYFCDTHSKHLRNQLPDYTESHDAVQRVIDGLDGDTFLLYTEALWEVVDPNEDSAWDTHLGLTYKATPLQKCEAILRAVGKWDEE